MLYKDYTIVEVEFVLRIRAFSFLCLSDPHSLGSISLNLLHPFVVAHHRLDVLLQWRCFPVPPLLLLLLKDSRYIRFLQTVAALLEDALKLGKLMLRVNAFVLALGRRGFDDGVNQFLQGVVLVGHCDLAVGCGYLSYECSRVFDVLHRML